MSKKQLGRPSAFTDKLKDVIVNLAREGRTVDQISETLNICRATLYNWMGKHPDLLDAVKASRSAADELVEIALFQRALGARVKKTKHQTNKETGEITTIEYFEHLPPDPTSMIFWLKNRQPQAWRDQPEVGGDDKELPQPIYTVINGQPDKTPA